MKINREIVSGDLIDAADFNKPLSYSFMRAPCKRICYSLLMKQIDTLDCDHMKHRSSFDNN